MKLQAVFRAIVATSLGLGGPAFAQGDGGPQPQDNAQRQYQRPDQRHPQRNFQGQRQQRDVRQHQRGWQQPQRDSQQQRRDEYRNERGAGPDHEFRRGDRLPPAYRNRNYVVDDWRGHHLNAPPRGHQWVQVGSDYVLVAIATGVIVQLLLND